MITTRTGFEEAIRNKMPQRALVTFPALPVIFTNEDIAVNGGIEFSELLNGEENLCMGRAVQSNVSVTLINSDKLLSSVDFTKEFIVALGVEVDSGETAVDSGSTLAVKVGHHVITASSALSKVYLDGVAYSISGTAAALFVYEDTLYVIGDTGAVINAFTISSSAMTAAALPEWNAFMLGKAAKWAAQGTCLSYVDNVMQECSVSAGVMAYRTSQFVPLGHFIGNKPDKVKAQIVSLSGDDLMQKFEVNAAGYFDTLAYPATLRTLFEKLCEYCGVEVGDVSAALNMDKQFTEAPINNDVSTCREVLAYIAEAAGCYARMSRDGKCELVWFADADYTLQRTDYFNIDIAEYTVQKINKLQSHVTQDDVGVIVGDGTNGYDIINNPYLAGTSDAEMRPWVENVYNRLAAFPEYSPITVASESNWALCCGDVIAVETEEGNKQLPIFVQTISWSGNARASIQSTGEQTRGVMTATNREKLSNGRSYLNVQKQVDGLRVEIGKKVDQGGEYNTTSVHISDAGMMVDTDGIISFSVDDIEQVVINDEGVSAKYVVADEIHAPNIVEMHMSSTAEWKGGIQATIDALSKYLTQDTELTIPAGTYREDVVIRGFYGSRLRLTFAEGATLNGTMSVYNCSHVVVRATSLGNGYIYPRSGGDYALGFYAVTRAQVSNMYISGYRLRTTASNGSDIALYFNSCHALVENCCLEYANKGLSTNYSIVYVENTRGGQRGNDPMTNANLGKGILASSGSHVHLVGSYPMGGEIDYDTYRGELNTYSLGSATPGGMEYTEPEYITQTFNISKHCTYLYGVSRTRDDQSNLFSQGRYGTYEVASHTNYWRIGAMWFADAAAALAGKTIQSAQLKIRRGSGGWSNAVGVYLGKVALAESAFNSTLTPSFTAASTYPIGSLKRETEATYDVTDLISAIQAGQAIGVFEPRDDYSGNYSPAYTTFYGKGSNYEPTLTVTYK